ncbi:MAG TPA: IspD/TarI family cytidylyltransferase [Chlamydiales bacterium]|nr:IspD/TarI family cytidylyltransferase [Chlamydiales bacterium]
MFNGFRIGAILLMSGSGNRFGSEIPKQFLLLGKKKLYFHTLEALQSAQIFDEMILVTHPDWIETVASEVPRAKVIPGAMSRQGSCFCGLKAFSQPPDIVLVHDAVRPFVSKEILIQNIEQAIIHGAVDTCIPSADTLVHAVDGLKIDHIPDRAHYYRGQTPQTFRYEWLMQAHVHSKRENATDDCALVLERGLPVHIVQGEDRNIKITTKFDINIAELILNNN